MDYMEYAYLQTAQDRKAKQVRDELLAYTKSAGANLPTAYAVAAIPARYAVERNDWKTAATLETPAIGFPLDKCPGAAAVLAYARKDEKKAIELARQAADLDATMDKHPATPAAVLPARELLAD